MEITGGLLLPAPTPSAPSSLVIWTEGFSMSGGICGHFSRAGGPPVVAGYLPLKMLRKYSYLTCTFVILTARRLA